MTNDNQRARAAALRIGNGHEEPGDRDLVLNTCPCLFCCARGTSAAPVAARPRPHPGGFGSTEASRVTVGYGPGRWNREVTVDALANGTVNLRRP